MITRSSCTNSALRYGTRFSRSIWEVAFLCELSSTEGVEFVDSELTGLPSALTTLSLMAVNSADAPVFAFEGTTRYLRERVSDLNNGNNSFEQQFKEQDAVAEGLENELTQLAIADAGRATLIAHELLLRGACGNAPSTKLFELWSDASWRFAVFGDCSDEFADLMVNATIEVALAGGEDWKHYLPHFFALTCGQVPKVDRRRLLFAATVISCNTFNSVGAVERLLTGSRRHLFSDFAKAWRDRIDSAYLMAPSWVSARLRSLRAVLHG